MKITKYMASAAIVATMFTTTAYAQSEDEPWEGGYIGGSIGYTVQQNDIGESTYFDTNLDGNYNDTVRTAAVGNPNAFSPGFCNGAATGSAPVNCTNDEDDIEYYGRAGYDVQSGNIVYGVVLEGGTSKATDSVTAFSTTPASYTFTRELDYTLGARGRLGYAPGGALFYVTGGAAYAKIDNSFTTSNTANSFTNNGKTDSWGWTAGGGTEVKLGKNFSIGLEYLYSNYVDDDFVVAVGPGNATATNPFLRVNPAGTNIVRSDSDFDTHSVRLTAGFRF